MSEMPITWTHLWADGWVRFDLSGADELISCGMTYSVDGGPWRPAALFETTDTDEIVGGQSRHPWNQGALAGVVAFAPGCTSAAVYWNVFLNIPRYPEQQRACVRAAVLSASGVATLQAEVDLTAEPGVVYLNDWDAACGSDPGWTVRTDSLGLRVLGAADGAPPGKEVTLRPGVAGTYDVYVCIGRGPVQCSIRSSACEYPTTFVTGGGMGAVGLELYETSLSEKRYIETFWKTIELQPDSSIAIKRIYKDYEAWPFGELVYVKLAPSAGKRAFRRRADRPWEVCLYFEPQTLASMHRRLDVHALENVVPQYLEFGPYEITCQVSRIGSKTIHYSETLDRDNEPGQGDDNVIHSGPPQMVRNMDVLKELLAICKPRGQRVTVNLGVNRPYIRSPEYTEGFVKENLHLIKDDFLDYSRPEVIEYALRYIEETTQSYEVDGLFLDFMRTEMNQTAATLVDFIRQTRRILDRKPDMTLSVRIPATLAHYYEAARVWVGERLVQVIVPSHPMEMIPLPAVAHYVALCRQTDTKVYGCLDGWRDLLYSGLPFGDATTMNSPQRIRQYVDAYARAGADGLFVYQAENYVFNGFVHAGHLYPQ